jgi:hypothetical protein
LTRHLLICRTPSSAARSSSFSRPTGRGGSWCESFATEAELRAFLRGIRVTYAMSDLQRLLPDFGDKPFAFTEQSAVQYLP